MKLTNKEDIENTIYSTIKIDNDFLSMSDELRTIEELFYKVFELNPCPMSINSLNDGYIIDVNQSFLDIIDVKNKKDILGKITTEEGLNIIKHKDKKYVIDYIKKNGLIKNYLTTFKTLKGKKIKGLFSASIITLNKKECLLTICQIVNRICLTDILFR